MEAPRSNQGTTIAFIDGWRCIVTDKEEGILVMDLIALTEAEAKGKAHTAATEHLKCKNIINVIVMKHIDMPPEWFKIKANQNYIN